MTDSTNLSDSKIVQDISYYQEHNWVKTDGEHVIIGISDFAQNQLGEIIFIDLPEPGSEYEQNDVFGFVESIKATSDLYMPVSVVVTEINDALADTPELANSQPYEGGWMIKAKVTEPDQVAELLTAEAYQRLLQ